MIYVDQSKLLLMMLPSSCFFFQKIEIETCLFPVGRVSSVCLLIQDQNLWVVEQEVRIQQAQYEVDYMIHSFYYLDVSQAYAWIQNYQGIKLVFMHDIKTIQLMSKQLRNQRLNTEYQDALDALQDQDQEKVQSSIKAIILGESNGFQDYSQWIIIFQGKQYTNLQGGNYKLRVKVGEKYPYEPPEVWCVDGFQHFHVFSGGKVCYKLLNKENWKIAYTILILVNGIIKMLHSDPQISDPASTTLTKLVQKGQTKYHQPNLKQYNKFLKQQAKKFSNRYDIQIKKWRADKKLPELVTNQNRQFDDQ